MATPFAAIEARINAAVVSHLANATADFGGGVVVDGIFRASYSDAFGMVNSEMSSFEAETDDLTGVEVGDTVTVGGKARTVSSIQPDGTGITLLALK
jgi:hypothetical protein